MTTATLQSVPARRADLIISEVGPAEYVVKQPRDGKYFRFGAEEYFLLERLDGVTAPDAVCAAFAAEFDEGLSSADLDEFIRLARSRGLLTEAPGATQTDPETLAAEFPEEDDAEFDAPGKRQNPLFWRKSLFDPDHLLDWLEPRLRFIWTVWFAAGTAVLTAAALYILVVNRAQAIAPFPLSANWETFLLAWIAVIVATMLHEFAHGLTCKHFGGEVHEIGVLFILFTPCLYCNVSDAWLIPQRYRRLLITFAGPWCDLCLWSLSVFVWRLTVPETTLHYLAWVMLSVCGARTLLNLNPLIRMDGYYLLCDLTGVANLRPRALKYWMEHIRWLLWGAPRPEPTKCGLVLVAYGMMIWCFAIVFLDFVIFHVFEMVGEKFWLLGITITSALVSIASRRAFKGFFAGELVTMLKTMPRRTTCWAAAIVLVLGGAILIRLDSTATGTFEVRPTQRVEVHAAVAGFLSRIHVAEGDEVRAGQVVAELQLPDLESSIVRKRAEIRECQAALNKLTVGTRSEELREQNSRVERAEAWRDLAIRDLERARETLRQDLIRLKLEVEQTEIELAHAESQVERSEWLYKNDALAGEQLRSEKQKRALRQGDVAQARARLKARESDGVQRAEAELAEREKELADVAATLSLMEAGSRPEEIEAMRAKLARLEEELDFALKENSQLVIRAPADGIVCTPRLQERLGQLIPKGAPLCVLQDSRRLTVEIVVPEEDVAGVKPGQPVRLKARALPFDTITANVDRVAPSAVTITGQTQNTVTVYCIVENQHQRLKSGMTGFARIVRGRKSAAGVLFGKGLKYVRTEFWW